MVALDIISGRHTFEMLQKAGLPLNSTCEVKVGPDESLIVASRRSWAPCLIRRARDDVVRIQAGTAALTNCGGGDVDTFAVDVQVCARSQSVWAGGKQFDAAVIQGIAQLRRCPDSFA